MHEHLTMFMSLKTVLKVAVKSMNCTIGENGVVPFFLLFGVLPRFLKGEYILLWEEKYHHQQTAPTRLNNKYCFSLKKKQGESGQ